jgi:hypothetical protein
MAPGDTTVGTRPSSQGKSGDWWREAVDVLWVSTGFFVGVIDMAVVL